MKNAQTAIIIQVTTLWRTCSVAVVHYFNSPAIFWLGSYIAVYWKWLELSEIVPECFVSKKFLASCIFKAMKLSTNIIACAYNFIACYLHTAFIKTTCWVFWDDLFMRLNLLQITTFMQIQKTWSPPGMVPVTYGTLSRLTYRYEIQVGVWLQILKQSRSQNCRQSMPVAD